MTFVFIMGILLGYGMGVLGVCFALKCEGII